MSRKKPIMIAASIGALLFAAPLATAQEDVSEDGTHTLGTVTVTAQKREQDLQDVPASIGVMPGDAVENALSGIDDVLGLSNRIPGLHVESSNGRQSPRFYIRGLGNTDFDTAASQPVSVIMDEVVLENVILKGFPVFDVAQVELLRGPQGTLFGRNTPAGIVKFDTAKPTDEFEASMRFNYGNFNTVNSEFAVGGPLIEDVLNYRLSALYMRQDDWVDNVTTGEENFSGGFHEAAVRAQFDYTPNEKFSALALLSYANSDASASFFRANVLTTGSNELNSNFDRDVVAYDGGGGNPASRDIWLSSLKIEYEMDNDLTFTSVTSYSDLDREGRGDIDGGTILFGQTGVTPPAPFENSGVEVGGNTSFPGFIPFPSDTGGTSESDQFTQEIRLASDTSGRFDWQVGAFFFENSLLDSTDAQFTFTRWKAEAESWAVFGQGNYDLTDTVTLTGGLRYTNDEKTFTVLTPPTINPGYLLPNGTLTESIDDAQVSWDLSASYAATDDVNVFARVARGFRGPSIQGRNVAFAGPTSQAQSETVISYEAGVKSTLLEDTLRLNATAYFYTVDDIQLTAVGGDGNFISLINAEKAKARGFEVDLDWSPNENFFVSAGFAYVDTEIDDEDLGVQPCGGPCTVLDPLNANGFALIDGNPLPQAPETSFNIVAQYNFPMPGGNELYINTDWVRQGETNIFLYESEEFNHDGNFEGGARVGYIFNDGGYEVGAFVRNITDEENLIGAIDFNNLTGFVNQPRVFGVSLRADF